MSERQPTCAERWQSHYESRLDDFREIFAAIAGDAPEDSEYTEDSIYEYGLCFDYVAPDTFEDQPQGYWRYQLSWGGPSDEFRFYGNPDCSAYRTEYWFMDWYDGEGREVDDPIVDEIVGWFEGVDAFRSALEAEAHA